MVIDALVTPFQVFVRQRTVISQFVQRELRTRYGTSAAGIGWVLIRPLTLLVIYTFVFSTVMNVRFGDSTRTVDFAFYLFCGMVPWLAFSDGIGRATTSISEHSPLVKRLRFPSEILPLHQVLVALAIESVGLLILFGALVIDGRSPGWPFLTLAVIVLPQILLTTGIAWFFAALAVFVPDMRHFVPFGMMVWMYATPIFYPLASVPERLHWLYQLNPMTYLVEAYRGAMLEHQAPALATLGVFCAASIAVFIAGYWTFNRLKYEFADVL